MRLRSWTGEEDWVTRRRRTQLVVFRRLAVSAGITLTAGLVLTQIPAVRAVGLSLFASAGVAGLAARPAVSNLIAGIQLALTQPIRIGDAVVVEGDFGTVEEITATYVTITTWDQRSLVVPLNYFMEWPIRNGTKRSTQLLDTHLRLCRLRRAGGGDPRRGEAHPRRHAALGPAGLRRAGH